ncbi:MAG: FlgB family protein [Pseudomonadota bacterium]
MFERLEILAIARDLAVHAGARQTVTAENVANADTPGYRARDLPDFSEIYRSGKMETSLRQTRASHMDLASRGMVAFAEDTDGAASPNGNTVSLESELVRAADIRSQHNRALSVYGASLDMIRAAIGRSR